MFANILLLDRPDEPQLPAQRRWLNDPAVTATDNGPAADPSDSQEPPKPMQGLRFARMSGPGPWFCQDADTGRGRYFARSELALDPRLAPRLHCQKDKEDAAPNACGRGLEEADLQAPPSQK